jgi:hypothetical protein
MRARSVIQTLVNKTAIGGTIWHAYIPPIFSNCFRPSFGLATHCNTISLYRLGKSLEVKLAKDDDSGADVYCK